VDQTDPLLVRCRDCNAAPGIRCTGTFPFPRLGVTHAPHRSRREGAAALPAEYDWATDVDLYNLTDQEAINELVALRVELDRDVAAARSAARVATIRRQFEVDAAAAIARARRQPAAVTPKPALEPARPTPPSQPSPTTSVEAGGPAHYYLAEALFGPLGALLKGFLIVLVVIMFVIMFVSAYAGEEAALELAEATGEAMGTAFRVLLNWHPGS
jgi:hypothetical protein